MTKVINQSDNLYIITDPSINRVEVLYWFGDQDGHIKTIADLNAKFIDLYNAKMPINTWSNLLTQITNAQRVTDMFPSYTPEILSRMADANDKQIHSAPVVAQGQQTMFRPTDPDRESIIYNSTKYVIINTDQMYKQQITHPRKDPLPQTDLIKHAELILTGQEKLNRELQ